MERDRACGKICHATRERAEGHRRNFKIRGRRRRRRPLKPSERGQGLKPNEIQAYYCLRCEAWHVGHDPRYNLGRTDDRKRRVS